MFISRALADRMEMAPRPAGLAASSEPASSIAKYPRITDRGVRSSCEARLRNWLLVRSSSAIRSVMRTRSSPAVIIVPNSSSRATSSEPKSGMKALDKATTAPRPLSRGRGTTTAFCHFRSRRTTRACIPLETAETSVRASSGSMPRIASTLDSSTMAPPSAPTVRSPHSRARRARVSRSELKRRSSRTARRKAASSGSRQNRLSQLGGARLA